MLWEQAPGRYWGRFMLQEQVPGRYGGKGVAGAGALHRQGQGRCRGRGRGAAGNLAGGRSPVRKYIYIYIYISTRAETIHNISENADFRYTLPISA